MWRTLLRTESDWMLFALRVVLGAVMLPHGAQKLLGWFGGLGVAGTLGYFASLGIPAPLGALAILAETAGALALLLGLLGRVAAGGLGGVLLTAALLVHLPNGFFMNWFGNQAGEGIEFFLLGLAIAAVLVARGSGALSVDRALATAGLRPVAAPARPARAA